MVQRINNGWEFADSLLNRLPGWPSEKQLVMITTFAMGFTMLVMARNDAALWNVELFKTLITVVVVTGCINMILAFYFTANKSEEARAAVDEKRADTTAKAFEAIKAVSSVGSAETIREGDTVTLEKS